MVPNLDFHKYVDEFFFIFILFCHMVFLPLSLLSDCIANASFTNQAAQNIHFHFCNWSSGCCYCTLKICLHVQLMEQVAIKRHQLPIMAAGCSWCIPIYRHSTVKATKVYALDIIKENFCPRKPKRWHFTCHWMSRHAFSNVANPAERIP